MSQFSPYCYLIPTRTIWSLSSYKTLLILKEHKKELMRACPSVHWSSSTCRSQILTMIITPFVFWSTDTFTMCALLYYTCMFAVRLRNWYIHLSVHQPRIEVVLYGSNTWHLRCSLELKMACNFSHESLDCPHVKWQAWNCKWNWLCTLMHVHVYAIFLFPESQTFSFCNL